MDLALDHVGEDRFVLGDIGELQAWRGDVASISDGRRTWRCERALRGFGQVIAAVDMETGERAARYVPRGFMRRYGIEAGDFHIGAHTWGWEPDGVRPRSHVLTYNGLELAEFRSGSVAQPVHASLASPARTSPMLVLLCCYVVKLAVDVEL